METEELLVIIENAIDNISQRNYEVSNPTNREINEEIVETKYSTTNVSPEINFVSSLKSKIEFILNNKGFDEDENPELFPQSDFGKRVFNFEKHRDLKATFKINDITKPDLFFHLSQEDNTPENQKIILECKIEKNISEYKIKKDLAKLILFVDQLNFQKGIFLICNNQEEDIETHIDDFVSNFPEFEESLSHIEIWIKNFGEEIIKRNFR